MESPVERDAPGAEHHGGLQFDDRDPRSPEQVADLVPARQVPGQGTRIAASAMIIRTAAAKPAQVHHPAHTRIACRSRERPRRGAVTLGEVGPPSQRVHEVVGGGDTHQWLCHSSRVGDVDGTAIDAGCHRALFDGPGDGDHPMPELGEPTDEQSAHIA